MRGTLVLAALGLAGASLFLWVGGGSAGSGPTYSRDVAPILDAKCTGCHRLGGIAPFALTTARNARAHAAAIARAVRTREMPPWMPGQKSMSFVGEEDRRLTRDEIALLTRWAANGAPAGPAAAPRSKPSTGPALSGPGRTLTVAPAKPYVPRAAPGATDDYRCFLLDPKLKQDVYVTASTVRPGRKQLVHHVVLFEVTGAQADAAEELNAASNGKGWTCFGGPRVGFDFGSPGAEGRLGTPPWLGAWVPGATTTALPRGTGVLLHRGAKIVMQVHYNVAGPAAADRSTAQLRVRPAATPLRRLDTELVAAPVEIPCPAPATAPRCSRVQALADRAAQLGLRAALVPQALLQLCGKSLSDYPRKLDARQRVASSCDRAVTTKKTIYGVGGHMHVRGREVSVVLNPGTSRERTLLHIPRWDFHWQDLYFLKRPIDVEPGDVLRVRCTWENAKRAQPIRSQRLEPRYVLWGEGTADEMCIALLSVSAG